MNTRYRSKLILCAHEMTEMKSTLAPIAILSGKHGAHEEI